MHTTHFPAFWRWVLPGLIAGLVFLAIALVTGAISTSFWGMPDGIARTIGLAAPADYGFAAVPVISGIMVHLALSIGLGALFTAIATWRRFQGRRLILAGFLFIMIETPIVLWGILHTVLSADAFHYYLGAIPWWGSVLGHVVYGVLLGWLLTLRSFSPDQRVTQQAAAPGA